MQLDTFKIALGLNQYTATDDCIRVRVLGLYSARTAKDGAHFLGERLLEELSFLIQRIQTDQRGDFFGMAFQRALREQCIKFRPIPPRSPHLNGKVERSHQTDWVEFYAAVDLQDRRSKTDWVNGISSTTDIAPTVPSAAGLRWIAAASCSRRHRYAGLSEAFEFALPEAFRERNSHTKSLDGGGMRH